MLELSGITKRFGATTALQGVHFSVPKGEVRGLVGHNGAGKSTMIKAIAGAIPADSGQIRIDGEPVEISSPAQAHRLGIRVIHQDAPLVPSFDTVENCYLGREYPRRLGVIDRAAMRESIATLAREIAPELPLDVPVAQLSPSQKQFVRLLRALADEGRILVLDEPTAALPAEDAQHFFRVLERVRARGTSIVLVSHRLDEIVSVCQGASVLRDGQVVAELVANELSVPALIEAMGGSHVAETAASEPALAGAPVMLKIKDLVSGELTAPASLSVRQGEVVALYGLIGSGRSSLLNAIWGAAPVAGGSITLDGVKHTPRSPLEAVRAGVSYVPADRHRTGLFAGFSLVFNKTLPLLDRYRAILGLPIPSRRREQQEFLTAAERVSLVFGSPHQLASTLSGGNQQKLLFSRWANRHSKVMLLDEPTEGVDVMAKATIKEIIRAIAADGNAVIVSTSDREEAIELGDRVVVFRAGGIVKAFTRAEVTPEALSAAAQSKEHATIE